MVHEDEINELLIPKGIYLIKGKIYPVLN